MLTTEQDEEREKGRSKNISSILTTQQWDLRCLLLSATGETFSLSLSWIFPVINFQREINFTSHSRSFFYIYFFTYIVSSSHFFSCSLFFIIIIITLLFKKLHRRRRDAWRLGGRDPYRCSWESIFTFFFASRRDFCWTRNYIFAPCK